MHREKKIDFEDLIKNAPDAFFLGDSNGEFVYANDHVYVLTGYDHSELVGQNITKLFDAEELKENPLRYDLVDAGNSVISHRKLRKKDGSYIDTQMITKKMKDGGYQTFLRDISDIVSTRKKLEENEKKYRATFLTSPDAIALNRLDGTYVDINEGFTNLTGYTRDDLIGKSSSDIEIWANAEDRSRLIEMLQRRGSATNFLATFKMKDGSHIEALMSSKIIDINGVKHHLSLTRDVSNFIRVQEDALKQKEQLAVTLKHIDDGVITTDALGNILLANDAACRLLGVPEPSLKGKKLSSIINIKAHKNGKKPTCIVSDVLEQKTTVRRNHNIILESADSVQRVVRDVGSILHNSKGEIIGAVIVFHDVTEYDRLMEALHNSQKLESLGMLAGGIAHDFNNLLAGIFGFINLAGAKTTSSEVKNYLDRATSAMDRALNLTGQLVTFASGGTPVKRFSDIVQVVKEVSQFALSGSDINLIFDVAQGQQKCSFDQNKISQVIDNIIINAKQTTPPATEITVKIFNTVLEAKNSFAVDVGNYMCISISDNGSGMTEDVKDRIFEPFFTTKDEGHGLGLATSYSIIKKHEGTIFVESEFGKGATFTIFLPIFDDESPEVDIDEDVIFKGTGRILIMDDEDIIQEFLSENLKGMGFSVDVAKNGEQVLEYLNDKDSLNRYTAMMFDLTIKGGMGGKALINIVRNMNFDIPIFVVSGYSSDSIMSNPTQYGFTDTLSKPFNLKQLNKLFHKHFAS